MTKTSTSSLAISRSLPTLAEAFDGVEQSFDRFCLTAGIQALEQLLEEDAVELCGARHQRGAGRAGYRWGETTGPTGFHGGKVAVRRPRVRSLDGREVALPSWRAAGDEDWLGKWAMNLMLINVSTRKYARGASSGGRPAGGEERRHFEVGGLASLCGVVGSKVFRVDGLRPVAARPFGIQIDGLHVAEDILLVGAIGIDAQGKKHPLGLMEGATENAAVVQALIDNLIERGLDPNLRRLFVLDGAKALSKAIRRTFGAGTPIQRCQVHKARNIIERCPPSLHASVRKALRQAWELDDADKAERLLRNLARRLQQMAPGVAASILEGLDEILTVNRLGLPAELRRSLACTNAMENMLGTVRRVCRNVKRWRHAGMALRWTAAGMQEAAKGFRRLKAYKQLPQLRAALAAQPSSHVTNIAIEPTTKAA